MAEISGITRKTLYKVDEMKSMVRRRRGDLLNDKDAVIAGQAMTIKLLEQQVQQLRSELAKVKDKTEAIRQLKENLTARLHA